MESQPVNESAKIKQAINDEMDACEDVAEAMDENDGGDDCDDESSSSDDTGERPVLAYDPSQLSSDLDRNGLPQNGHDYLKLLQEERAQCPAIVSVPLPPVKDKRKFPDSETSKTKAGIEPHQLSASLPTPQTNLVDELEYRDEILNNFRTLRDKICSIRESTWPDGGPKNSDLEQNKNLEGDEQLQSQIEKSTMQASSLIKLMELGQPPQLSSLLYKSQIDLHMTLEKMADRCEHPPHGIIHTDWVYSLMAALREPIEPDICSTIRRLARICIARRKLYEKKKAKQLGPNEFAAATTTTTSSPTLPSASQQSSSDSAAHKRKASSSKALADFGSGGVENNEELVRKLEEEEYNSCLLIICIVRHYFGQADLR